MKIDRMLGFGFWMLYRVCRVCGLSLFSVGSCIESMGFGGEDC